MPTCRHRTLIALAIGGAASVLPAFEREAVALHFHISDAHVGAIDATRTVSLGLPFEFRDLAGEAPESPVQTLVSGFCTKAGSGYAIDAHRVTIKRGTFIRSDWFRQTLDPHLPAAEWAVASVAMGSATLFHVSLAKAQPSTALPPVLSPPGTQEVASPSATTPSPGHP